MTAPQLPERPRRGRAVAVYTGLRALLLVGCLLLGWLAGLRGALLLIVALLVSGVLSWFLLARQRLAMGVAVDDTAQRLRHRAAEKAAAEDAYADRLAAGSDVTHSDR